jgi:HK97 gp10 family phage protein
MARQSGIILQIDGLREIDRALSELPTVVGRRIMDKGLRRAANVIAREAKSRAPVGDRMELMTVSGRRLRGTTRIGLLRREVRVVFTERRMGQWARPGVLKRAINVRITRREAFSTEVNIGVGKAYWGMFQEFGTSKMKAQPFLRPALDAKGEEAVQEFKKVAWEEIRRRWEGGR